MGWEWIDGENVGCVKGEGGRSHHRLVLKFTCLFLEAEVGRERERKREREIERERERE